MKTICKGVSKRVPFLAFLDFVFYKAEDVTFFLVQQSLVKGVFVARRQGCKNRVFVNISYFTARIASLVAADMQRNYQLSFVTEDEYLEILKNLKNE